MLDEHVMGWDLGGAHLKVATVSADGQVRKVMQQACQLWKGLDELQRAVRLTMDTMPAGCALHAVTMTGELVDLFATREQGVRALIDAMNTRVSPVDVRVYAGRLGFVEADQALRNVDLVASANWLASVTLAAMRVDQGLFVDVGSTTTDVLPFRHGLPAARGHTDYDRLRYDELIYTGAVRTPVMSLTHRVPFEGAWINLMAESFATTADIHRLTNTLPEHADILPSADGGGKSRIDSARRLARMLGRDLETASMSAWERVAFYLAGRQLERIADACACNLSLGIVADDAPLVGAGVGRFLVRALALRFARPYRDFGDLFPDSVHAQHRLAAADCAPAVAVAKLAQLHLRQTVPARQVSL